MAPVHAIVPHDTPRVVLVEEVVVSTVVHRTVGIAHEHPLRRLEMVAGALPLQHIVGPREPSGRVVGGVTHPASCQRAGHDNERHDGRGCHDEARTPPPAVVVMLDLGDVVKGGWEQWLVRRAGNGPGLHCRNSQLPTSSRKSVADSGGWMEGVVWDDGMDWGHAVSQDLVHWRHLPLAMLPDHWYDNQGVLSGSITMLSNGTLVMLYTGVYTTAQSTKMAEVQCLAVPADPNDPLLQHWTKHPANPVLAHPAGIKDMDFRDPTSAWWDESDATWRTLIGSKDDDESSHAGIAFVFKTKDFLSFERIPGLLHRVEGTGMWECIDFYPIGGGNNSEVLHVIKASMDDERHDYYSLGRYNATANTWTPIDAELDLGIGLRYDWGKLYASTSFYDPSKQRRIMLGYVGEVDSTRSDVAKGWASIQSIPRTVTLDPKTRTNLLLWPVEEIEALRYNATELSSITIDTGSVLQIPLRQATQLDIEASFRLDASAVAAVNEADVAYNCSSSGGAAARGALGPFGLLVHAAGDRRGEQTAIYFYVSRALDGSLRTSFCNDESRSSRARDVTKRVVGSTVPVLDGEALSMRVLVDHSIVQSFAMGGRSTATSRVYPTEAIYTAAGVYLFNNATGAGVTAERVVVHEMNSSTYNDIVLADAFKHTQALIS